jgi:hypothetical protein
MGRIQWGSHGLRDTSLWHWKRASPSMFSHISDRASLGGKS